MLCEQGGLSELRLLLFFSGHNLPHQRRLVVTLRYKAGGTQTQYLDKCLIIIIQLCKSITYTFCKFCHSEKNAKRKTRSLALPSLSAFCFQMLIFVFTSVHVPLCGFMLICSTQNGQKMALDPLELKLKLPKPAQCQSQIQVPRKNSECPYPPSHSSSP